jgi:diguanylate cyclase (GGDEF)-like protein
MQVALEERRAVVIDDWSTESRYEFSGLARAVGAVSTISVPIQGPKGAWGVLSTHSREQRSFAPDEVSFVQAIANVLGAAIQRWLVEEDTRHRALHDPLTELPNRTLFLDRLGHALDRARRGGGQAAVLFLDLDHFKVINDSLGHEAGDKLLQAFAPRLQETLRPSDTVARFGGDEFVVLCEDLQSEADAAHLAERILGSLEKPFQIDQHELFTSATIGLALARDDSTPEGLISDADAAMYRAKAEGRSRYGLFDQAMRRRVSERLRTENALRKALVDGGLELHFQPIVALEDRAIVAAEALLRWHDAERGWISPADFITIAEESGLIVPLGEWVLEEAARLALRWPASAPGKPQPRLAVNLSARQVAHPAFCERLAATLERTGLAPERLSLEITESILIDGADGPMNAMREIKGLGVRLALDDFGTGYSSLSYLNRLPIDVLKLDRSFIAPLREPGHTMAAIVSGMITMAEALGMTVVAEGVEELSQAERLRALGCDFAQGFLFARPMPPDELDALLRAGALPAPPSDPQTAER